MFGGSFTLLVTSQVTYQLLYNLSQFKALEESTFSKNSHKKAVKLLGFR